MQHLDNVLLTAGILAIIALLTHQCQDNQRRECREAQLSACIKRQSDVAPSIMFALPDEACARVAAEVCGE